jgi:hypothetical protein
VLTFLQVPFPPLVLEDLNHQSSNTYMTTLHLTYNIPFLSIRFSDAVCGSVYIEKPALYPFFTLPILFPKNGQISRNIHPHLQPPTKMPTSTIYSGNHKSLKPQLAVKRHRQNSNSPPVIRPPIWFSDHDLVNESPNEDIPLLVIGSSPL